MTSHYGRSTFKKKKKSQRKFFGPTVRQGQSQGKFFLVGQSKFFRTVGQGQSQGKFFMVGRSDGRPADGGRMEVLTLL